jgi:hypothetical protein
MGKLADLGSQLDISRQISHRRRGVAAIKAVTVEDIHSLAKQLKPSEFTQFSLGPDKRD